MELLKRWWAWLTTPAPAAAKGSGPAEVHEAHANDPKDALPTGEPGEAPALPFTGGFSRCLPVILKWEGGNDDDPRDPGGRTSRGVIQSRYDQYRRSKGLPLADVWKATDAEIEDIYDIYYWQVVKGNYLPPGVDLVVFDSGVNSGPAQGAKWLQRTVGAEDDGKIGPATLRAVAAAVTNIGPHAVIDGVLDRRLAMLRGLRTWQYFGKGWANRIADIRKRAHALVK